MAPVFQPGLFSAEGSSGGRLGTVLGVGAPSVSSSAPSVSLAHVCSRRQAERGKKGLPMSSAVQLNEEHGPGLLGIREPTLDGALIVLSLLAAAALSYLPLIQQNRKLRGRLEMVRTRYEQWDAGIS